MFDSIFLTNKVQRNRELLKQIDTAECKSVSVWFIMVSGDTQCMFSNALVFLFEDNFESKEDLLTFKFI